MNEFEFDEHDPNVPLGYVFLGGEEFATLYGDFEQMTLEAELTDGSDTIYLNISDEDEDVLGDIGAHMGIDYKEFSIEWKED